METCKKCHKEVEEVDEDGMCDLCFYYAVEYEVLAGFDGEDEDDDY